MTQNHRPDALADALRRTSPEADPAWTARLRTQLLTEFESPVETDVAEPAVVYALEEVQAARLRTPMLLATCAAVVVLAGALLATRLVRPTEPPARTSPSARISPPTTTPGPDVTSGPTPTSTLSIPRPPTNLSRTYRFGDTGDEIKMIQTRLNELKFDVGLVDGVFGELTQAAIWAYRELLRDPKVAPDRSDDSNVTPALWARMQEPLDLQDWRPNATPRHVLVSLPSQVMIVWDRGTIALITHVSTGTGKEWCARRNDVPPWPGATATTTIADAITQKVCGRSLTPGGTFEIYRKNEGQYEDPLGTVHDPVYFNKGISIHGFPLVPHSPASKGNIRVPMHIGTKLAALLQVGDEVFIFDGFKTPEQYGAQPPDNDVLDTTAVG